MMNRLSALVIAALVFTVGLTAGTGIASGATLPDLPSNQFQVIDYGSYAVQYSGATDPDQMLTTRPKDGISYLPGDGGTWAFKKNIKKHTATLSFGDADPASPAYGSRSLKITLTTSDTSDNNIVHVACSGTGYICQVRGTVIYLVDDIAAFPDLATRTVSDAQTQYGLLQKLCTGGSGAPSCMFTTTSRVAQFGDTKMITENVYHQASEMVYSHGETIYTSTTTSFSETVTVGASYDVFKASVSKTYSTSITDSRTETDNLIFTVPPDYYFWIEGQSAVLRYTGEFALRMGNSTITLSGVHYDVPDTSRTSMMMARATPTDPGLGTVLNSSQFPGTRLPSWAGSLATGSSGDRGSTINVGSTERAFS